MCLGAAVLGQGVCLVVALPVLLPAAGDGGAERFVGVDLVRDTLDEAANCRIRKV